MTDLQKRAQDYLALTDATIGFRDESAQIIAEQAAEIERLRKDAERVMSVVETVRADRLRMYREIRSVYNEGASDVADSILTAIDAAMAGGEGKV